MELGAGGEVGKGQATLAFPGTGVTSETHDEN